MPARYIKVPFKGQRFRQSAREVRAKKMFVAIQAAVLLILSNPLVLAQRLPELIRPIHYDLAILPVLAGSNPRLCGHIYLDFEALTWTSLVIIHGANLDILDVTINSQHQIDPDVIAGRLEQLEDLCLAGISPLLSSNQTEFVVHDPVKQEWNIGLKEELIQGHRYRLGIFYKGKINKDIAEGFYRARYTSTSSNEDDEESSVTSCSCQSWFGATQMEPTHARKVFPCLDEPALKATFDVTVGHQGKMKALANMPQVSKRPMNNVDGWTWTTFRPTPPMSTYLLGIVITDYQVVERDYRATCLNSTVRIRFWTRPDYVPHLNRSIEMVPRILNYLETHLERPFPLPKIDFVTVPMDLSFSAMENWGLILISESKLLHDEEYDSNADLFQDAQVIVHEMVHQYFGNLVTHEWWSRLWIKEGLAVLYECVITQEVMPELVDHLRKAWTTSIQGVMRKEEAESTLPVNHPVEATQNTEDLFDQITYSKGSILFMMLQNFLGPNVFRKGLVTIIQRYQYGNVNGSHLWEVMNDEMRRYHNINPGVRSLDVAAIMDSWTDQSSYPIVRCFRYLSGRVHLSQSPYSNANRSSSSDSLWYIPITYWLDPQDFSESLPLPRLWLTPQRPSTDVFIRNRNGQKLEDTQWIILNAGMSSGYFRVQYDWFNYQLLSDQLLEDPIALPDSVRVQLIDDAFTLAEADVISHQIPIMLIRYLKTIDDPAVNSIAFNHLVRIKNIYRLHASDFQEYIEALVRRQTGPVISYRTFAGNNLSSGWMIRKADCKRGEQTCVHHARRLYKDLLEDNLTDPEDKRITSDKFELILCTAIQHGGDSEWKSAWRMSRSDEWALQRPKILSALTCTKEERRLKQLLSLILQDRPPGSDSLLTKMLAGSSTASSLARRFLASNRKELTKLDKLSRTSPPDQFLATLDSADLDDEVNDSNNELSSLHAF